MEEKQVLKQSVAIKKRHKPKTMSSDESGGKKKRQDKQKQQQKQQQPKADMTQPTNEPSTSRMMYEPCQNEACAGTSAAGSLSLIKQMSLDELYLDESRKNFNELDYSKILQSAEFTKEQNGILQQSFRQLFRKMSFLKSNSDRFLKTHKCKLCQLSVSHECMPLDFIRSVPIGTTFMNQGYMMPSQTVFCDCGFAFCHVHLKRTRQPVELSFVELNTPHLDIYDRSVDVSCRKCYTKMVINNSSYGVCFDLATWDCIAGDDRKKFYKCIQRGLHYSSLSLDEFYACSKNCCLMFHRCSGKVEAVEASGIRPDWSHSPKSPRWHSSFQWTSGDTIIITAYTAELAVRVQLEALKPTLAISQHSVFYQLYIIITQNRCCSEKPFSFFVISVLTETGSTSLGLFSSSHSDTWFGVV